MYSGIRILHTVVKWTCDSSMEFEISVVQLIFLALFISLYHVKYTTHKSPTTFYRTMCTDISFLANITISYVTTEVFQQKRKNYRLGFIKVSLYLAASQVSPCTTVIIV